MDNQQLIERLKDTPYGELARIAADSGISHATLAALKYGTSKDPRSSTIDRLRAYFQANGGHK